jgi:hypothetical protein
MSILERAAHNGGDILEAYEKVKGTVLNKEKIAENAIISRNPSAVYALCSGCGIHVSYLLVCNLQKWGEFDRLKSDMLKAVFDCIDPHAYDQAIKDGNEKVVNLILEAKTRRRINDDWEKIQDAILSDNLPSNFTALLENNDSLKDKALIFAIKNNKLDCMRDILSAGASADSAFTTALGKLGKGWDYVKVLLEHNLSAINKDKALKWAVKNCDLDQISDIIKSGASADYALDTALKERWHDCVEVLLDHGADAYKALKYYCTYTNNTSTSFAREIVTKYYRLDRDRFDKLCDDLRKDENYVISWILEFEYIDCKDCSCDNYSSCDSYCNGHRHHNHVYCDTCDGRGWYYDESGMTYEDLCRELYPPCKPYEDTPEASLPGGQRPPGARVQPCGCRFHPESILDLVLASKRN